MCYTEHPAEREKEDGTWQETVNTFEPVLRREDAERTFWELEDRWA